MHDPDHILITGASSGIGRALALAYAGPGRLLTLSGRDAARLDEVAGACTQAGADVAAETIDVADRAAMAAWIAEAGRERPIDLVVANAGISAGTGRDGESAEQARRIFSINVDGVVNTVQPAIGPMIARRRGQIAIMSSLAAFRGFPGAPAYCASKAAVKSYGEALRGALHRHGVGVTVICPGFVKSRMTAVNEYPMPMLMETDRAAQIMVRGLARNRPRIVFPLPLYVLLRAIAALPPGWTDPLFRALPAKE